MKRVPIYYKIINTREWTLARSNGVRGPVRVELYNVRKTEMWTRGWGGVAININKIS